MQLPDFSKAWDYENGFYLTCKPQRLGKLLAHLELYKMVNDLPGALIECGVFKGASLARFAMFRELFGTANSRRIIGFDAFGAFPETQFAADVPFRQRFIDTSGDEGISVEQLRTVLEHKAVAENIELIKGDVCETVPAYLEKHPELRVSLINLDTDVYEPAVTVLKHLYPRLVPGGVLVIDDYNVFPGETAAVDEFLAGKQIRIRKFPFHETPAFIVKD